jgi:hypothetical protein
VVREAAREPDEHKEDNTDVLSVRKPGHFIADYPEKTENKDGYKHRSTKDDKYRSMRDHKHKNKHKDE